MLAGLVDEVNKDKQHDKQTGRNTAKEIDF